MAANPLRGEIDLDLPGGEPVRLRPTIEALIDVEQRAGAGLVPLTRRFLVAEFGLKDALAVIVPCAKAAGHDSTDLASRVMRGGLILVGPVLAKFLSEAISGNGEAGSGV